LSLPIKSQMEATVLPHLRCVTRTLCRCLRLWNGTNCLRGTYSILSSPSGLGSALPMALIVHCEQRHATECAWFSVCGSLMPCWILVRGTCTASRPLRWSGIAMIDNSSNPYGDAISQKTHFNPLCHTAPRRGGSSGACRLRLQSGLSPGRPPQLANAGLVRQSQGSSEHLKSLRRYAFKTDAALTVKFWSF
jgi:hypothetical protein